MPKDLRVRLAIAALFALAVYWLGYRVAQSDFPQIIAAFALLFGGYFWILRQDHPPGSLRFYRWLGVALRVLLLFSLPALSDDVYRFIWDGRLINAGINPFAQLPKWYLENGPAPPGLSRALFEKLNSPEYFTIYPPVAQATFAAACRLFPDSIWGSALVMKLFLLGCEIGTLHLIGRLLRRWALPDQWVLIYALNPLIIVEIVGNLHFEGAMVFFLLLSWWWLSGKKDAGSGAAMALSVGAKLLPLMFFPLLIRRLGLKRSVRFFALSGIVIALLFAPLLGPAFWDGFSSSLDLYFRRFEFNAGFYYVARWLGYAYTGHNQIQYLGPALALVTLAGILTIAALEKRPSIRNWPHAMLGAITLYLFFTTTVHPWYVCLPVVLCTFTGHRYPLFWSALICLTYVNYSYIPYRENLWVVGIEYGLIVPLAAAEWLGWRPWSQP